jgi:hypothetical protein
MIKIIWSFGIAQNRRIIMISVTCTITLLTDNNRKVDIQIRKEDDGKLLWKIIESSKGSVKLPAEEGEWFNPDWSNILTLFYKYKPKLLDDTILGSGAGKKEQGLMLVAYNVKSDFLTDVSNNKSIDTNDAELFNGNYAEQKISCKLWKR